jgi:glycerol-3-phosphate dehydrogenase
MQERLGPSEHEAAWQRLTEEHLDVLVVGGGVTGAGAALDAATRGLSVGLVEARDLASGTSSRSSKLFHGGVRYLEKLDFSLVREALRERELMLTHLAPHLVKPVPILYPLKGFAWERPYVTAGLTLYDNLGGSNVLPRTKNLSRRGARSIAPGLRADALVGAVQYWDAQADDARHTLTVARTAARFGAIVRTSTEVVGLVRDGGRVVGAEIRDVESGAVGTVRADAVVVCAGVWTDDVEALSGSRGQFNVRASKGVHLVIPKDRLASESGIILRTEKSVLFVLPWGQHWLIGTTDTDWNLDLAHPAASRADIDYLLEQVNQVLARRLTRDDIVGVFAGLRPLLSGESEETSQLSREHAVARPLPGLVSIAGGKYTTYRVMAADAIDATLPDLSRRPGKSVTDEVPLIGADGYAALVNQADRLAQEFGIPAWRVRHLLDRYGSLIREVLEPAVHDPSLLESVPGADTYIGAEIRYGATHEGALHLDDLLARRTRISIETAHRGTESAAAAAGLVADVLGWSPERVQAEVDVYLSRVEAERASQDEPTDQAADAARLVAPDTRKIGVGRALDD